MAQRRSRNRRLSSFRRSNSGILADNTDIVDNDDPLWYNKSIIRPSTSFAMPNDASRVLNSDSSINVSQVSDDWFENLTQSENNRLTNEQNKSKYVVLITSESESEQEIQKKRAKLKSSQKSTNNKTVDESNDFSKALESTTDSHIRNITNTHMSDENDNVSNTDDLRTIKKLRPRFDRNKKYLKGKTNKLTNSDSASERFVINSSMKRKNNINNTTSCTPEKVRRTEQQHAELSQRMFNKHLYVSSDKRKTLNRSKIPIVETDNESKKSVETSSDESAAVGSSPIKPAAPSGRQNLTHDTSGQFSDDLLHPPKRAQSAPKINGKPTTQFSFGSDSIVGEETVAFTSTSHSRSVPSRSLPTPDEDVQKKNHRPTKRPPKEKLTTEREKSTRKDKSVVKDSSARKDKSAVQMKKDKPAVKDIAKNHLFTYFGDLPRNSKGLTVISTISEEDSAERKEKKDALKKKLERHMKNVRRLDEERAQKTTQTKNSKVSTMSEADWAKLKQRTDRYIEKVSKHMEEEERLKQAESQKKARLDAQLKRVLAQQEAERRRKEKKPIDPAYYVNGEVYKPPKLPRPENWVTNRLYKYLWKCLEPRYGQRTRVKSEKFVLKLADLAEKIEKCKKYENYRAELDELHRTMAKLNIIKTRYDFHRFCSDYMPYSFRIKAVPMMLPGNVRNIPFDPKIVFEPILDEDEENSESSDSDTDCE